MALGELSVKRDTFTEKLFHWKIPRFSALENGIVHEGPHFTFFNFDWCICIQGCQSNLTLYLELDQYVGRLYETKWSFGIIDAGGSVVRIKSFQHTFRSASDFEPFSFIRRDALLKHKTELIPLDNLTIMCHIELLSDPMKLRELNTMSENIQGLFINQEFCDITLQIKDKELKAHKVIIAARSPVFAAMFKHETSEKQTGIIAIPDCDPDSFIEFLRFLYTGKVENISFPSAIHLFKIADKYAVNELTCFCIDYMWQNMKMENFFDVVALAVEHGHDRLHTAVQDFFNRNLNAILKTADWENLLKTNFKLANGLLTEMSSNDEVIRKRPRLENS